ERDAAAPRAQDVAHATAQVQAAPRRGTVPGDGGGAFHRWRWSRPVTRRARNAGIFRRSVVTISLMRFHSSRMRLRACREPGVPRALLKGKERIGIRARPRRQKNRAGGAMSYSQSSPRKRGPTIAALGYGPPLSRGRRSVFTRTFPGHARDRNP